MMLHGGIVPIWKFHCCLVVQHPCELASYDPYIVERFKEAVRDHSHRIPDKCAWLSAPVCAHVMHCTGLV